jgi:hypothetical protein
MSTEITRRDFLELVFATASVTAVSGGVSLWPSNALARPIAEPAQLFIDGDGYIIDAYFDFLPDLPTFREHLGIVGLDRKTAKEALDQEVDRFEHIVEDPENWSLEEIEEWLDSQLELDDLGPYNAMKYTQYSPGIELYERLDGEVFGELGLELIDTPSMCSDFVGVRYLGDVDELNAGLARHGLNLIVSKD